MAIPNLISNVGLTGKNSIDSLIWGKKWGYSGRDTVVSLTYSFSNSNSYYPNNYSQWNEPLYSLGSLTSTQQNAVRNVLKAWSEIANIQFTEVADKNLGAQSNYADLRFARTSSKGPDQVNTAWGYYPEASSSEAPLPIAGDVWFTYNSKYDTDSQGTYGYYTFLHEIGHTLGLKHPHENGVVANLDTDTTAYSVMSYRAYMGQPIGSIIQSFFPTTPMLYDIAAIQYIYGANMNTRSGDTVYSWAPSQQILETIWDGGGNDTIDWSNQITNATINLSAGSWSKLGSGYGTKWNSQTNNWDIWNTNTLAIAYNVTIENANGGAGNDLLLGNEVSNVLRGNAGNDTLYGFSGNDSLDGGIGNDTLDGGIGNDSLVGGAGKDRLTGYGGTAGEYDTLTGGTGSDSFILGDSTSLFYAGAGSATITDWEAGVDKIEIHGSASQFTLISSGNPLFGTTSIYFGKGPLYTTDSLIGVVQSTDVNLLRDFIFINSGGAGNDTLEGEAGSDILYGNDGDDIIYGKAGNDNLVGGAGSDRLVGYGGTTGEYDTLTGGAGSDTFVLGDSTSIFYAGAGYATITDWQSGVDKIEIHGSAGPFSNQFSLSKNYLLGTTSISLNNAIFADDNLIAVVQSTDVNLSDFVFV